MRHPEISLSFGAKEHGPLVVFGINYGHHLA